MVGGDLIVCWRKGLTIQFTFSVRTLNFNFSLSMPILSDGGITAYFARTAMSMSGVVSCQLSPPLFTFSGRPGTGTINWIFFFNFSICARVRQVLFYVSFCKNLKNVNKGTSCDRAHVSI